ncbi:MAG: glycosyltransferase family 4 protein [Bacteroides sp.]|nr:glycosyltransferase family 4 protein [Bacteroides sp.]
MKIGFEGKRAVQNFTGLGNYSRYVVEALNRFAPQHEYILYAPRRRSSRVFDQMLEQCPALRVACPSGMWKKFKSLWRVWGVTSDLEHDKVDIFHGLSGELPLNIRKASGVKSVVTVHDLIFLRYPSYYHWLDRKIYAYKFRKACEQADAIIAISECTRRDIVSYFGIPESKIQVIYQGCDASFTRRATEEKRQEVREKYALPGRYILNVGSIEERKNVLLAVKALEHLPADVHLVIVGRRTPYTDKVEEYAHTHGLKERLHILNGVTFADLPAVYQQASVFVYPSRFEGFGIPIVEALHSEVPVIAATGSCLEEAGGPDSVYVHPDDEQAMTDALKEILSDADKCRRMIAKGKEYAARFSEERHAALLNELYVRLH